MLRRLLIAACAAGAAVAAGPAAAGAAPALSSSVVGEPPQGAGVFRFPQAVAVSPGGGTVWIADQYSGVVQAFDAAGNHRFTVGSRAARGERGRFGVIGGLATDRSGHVYVLDAENERVQVLDATDGHAISSFGNSTNSAVFDLLAGDPSTGAGISASGIAVAEPPSSSGPVVYVADQGHDRVERFVLDRTTLMPAGPPRLSGPDVSLAAPQGLALDPAATRLYVADDDNHRVLVLDPETLAQLGGTGTFGTGPGQFQNPYDVAVDDHVPAQLYVADNLNNRVDVFDAMGLGFLGTFGRPGYGPGVGNMQIVRSVGALADVPGGGVLAADTANNRIQAFDAAGTVVAAWGIAGRGAGYVTRPRGVAMAPDGGVAVADSFDQRIALFAGDGTFAGLRGQVSASTGFATQGPNPGQFSLPAGVAYDGSGNLWIADTGNDRVVALGPAGNVLLTTSAGALARPLSVAVGPGGTYVADTGNGRVVLIDAAGSMSTVGNGALSHPAAVAVTPQDGTPQAGVPYVADDTSVRNAVTGAPVAAPGGGTAWDHPAGLAFGPDGTLYVAERRPGTPAGARVVRGTPPAGGGTYAWDTIATEGDGPAQVIEPAGLALSPDGGTLLIADTGNNRVLRLDAPDHAPPPTATLRVGVSELARGTVTGDLPGIACPTDCRQSFGTGRTVTLTARAVAGSVLTGWTGACAGAGTAPTCALAMTGDQDAGATFAATPVVTPPPPPPPPPPPAVRITSVRLSTHVLHRARPRDRRRHRPARRATRATVTAVLTRPATVTALVQQGRAGRRQGSKCVRPTRANRRRAVCTRFVDLRRSRTLPAPATTLRFTLTPAFGGAQLAPGSYRLALTALDADGNRVGPVAVSFRITR